MWRVFILYLQGQLFYKPKLYSMCYATYWEPLPDSTHRDVIDNLRFFFEQAEKAPTEYDVLEGQSIGESLLLSLMSARDCFYKPIVEESENRHLLPLFADIEDRSSEKAVELLRQIPKFKNWYNPKEGDSMMTLCIASNKSIRHIFIKGTWHECAQVTKQHTPWA